MVAAYIRFSTSQQDETQQIQSLQDWTGPRGITIDEIVKDEGVSGGVSYRDRNLFGLVKRLGPGDTLVCSEISRLGRSMSDISNLLSQELKPRKIRLVVIKMGIDVDCSNLKATDEFIFSALSFAAQIEKELIQQRTQSALDARKTWLERDGGFISKTGRFCDHLGRRKGDKNPNAIAAMNSKQMELAATWKAESALYIWVENQLLKGRRRNDILKEAEELYDKDPVLWGTRGGCKLSKGVLSKWAAEILIHN